MTQQQHQPHANDAPATPEEELPQGGATPDAGTEAEAEAEAAGAEGEDALSVEELIGQLRAENDALRQDVLRARADVENIKRMADKRIQDNAKYALSNFIKELLPVADNLSRALSAASPEARAESQAMNTIAVGVEMTEKELLGALQKHGVTRFKSQGEPFDPHRHQAMQEVEKTDVPTGTVVQVYQDGYMIADRLLRPAMVVVSKGGPKREDPPVEDGQGGVDQTV